MDPKSSNPTKDSKHEKRLPYTETAMNRKTGNPSTSSCNWYEGHREPRKDHSKKREHELWNSCSRDGGTSSSRTRENFRQEETKVKFTEEQTHHQTHSYTTEMSTMSGMQSNVGMMPMVPYAQIAAMSSQWAMNPVDNMHVNNSGSLNMDMGASSGGMHPYGYMGMATDPNLYGMLGSYAPYGMLGTDSSFMARSVNHEIIHLSKGIMYPPAPGAPNETMRPKPLGCKTIFVGGVAENMTEDVLREIFERFGEISTIRMSKKNFCHIRFASESSVDCAIAFSGYRVILDNKDDAANSSRLHVDYAQARDDQHEYECRLRSMQREARHRERLEQEANHPATPPPVAHYSDHEAVIVGEKLRSEETVQQALFVLMTWLERGECNKKNAGTFYSMLQSAFSHVRRLLTEKQKCEDEFNKAKKMREEKMQTILLQFNELDKVFNVASMQKVWDHFSRIQRKNIEHWKKQTEDNKKSHIEEVLNDRIEDEMDVSDEDDDTNEKAGDGAAVIDSLKEKINKLQEEINILRSQLQASENELELERFERRQEKQASDCTINKLRQTIANIEEQLGVVSEKGDVDNRKGARTIKRRKGTDAECGELSHEQNEEEASCSIGHIERDKSPARNYVNPNSVAITPTEARWIGLISGFLIVHPFGASLDYICSFLQQVDKNTLGRDVETLMRKFLILFKEVSTGIGASLEKRWFFVGYQLAQKKEEN